jgi:dienelactone hydrolase
MRRFVTAVLILAALALPGPARAQISDDPTVAGPHAVTVVEYDADRTIVTGDRGVPYPEQLRGSLHVPDGAGPFPVVLLLHGRHGTCRVLVAETFGHPCPDTAATADVRSYRGYDYLARNLASHGYLVVSASANGVNTFDTTSTQTGGSKERAQVIARTLDLIDSWHKGPGPGDVGSKLVGRVDMQRIGLMGHSRGGEGVAEFISYNRTRTDGPQYPGVRAVLALAATDFGDQTPTGVHFGALLPLCDGDVSDLQGGDAYDRSRFSGSLSSPFARHQWVVEGANHNYFNTIWTADDNGDTAGACADNSPQRLTADAQRTVGLALINGFFRRYLGGETQFDGMLRGVDPLPATVCPDGIVTCDELVRTSYLAPPGKRDLLARPVPGVRPTLTGGVSIADCQGGSSGAPACPSAPNRSLADQWTMRWSAPGVVRIPTQSPRDVSAFEALTFRAAFNTGRSENTSRAQQNFDIVLIDADGNRDAVAAAEDGAALRLLPDRVTDHVVLGGVWLPLSRFAAVDLTRITAVELVVGQRTASGSVQLAELGFQR